MTDWITSGFLLLGAALMLLAAIGVVRLPDLPTRMHATTKSGVLGTTLIMLGVAMAFADITVSARVLAIISFVILTAPVAAHAIGRAGYFVGAPLWKGTVKDALREYLDEQGETHIPREDQAENDRHQ